MVCYYIMIVLCDILRHGIVHDIMTYYINITDPAPILRREAEASRIYIYIYIMSYNVISDYVV